MIPVMEGLKAFTHGNQSYYGYESHPYSDVTIKAASSLLESAKPLLVAEPFDSQSG